MKQKDSLRFLFAPRTIAVVGASNKEGKMGNLFVRNLLAGSPANIFPVHPTEREIAGVTAYPDINAIPETLDLVIPLIPGEQLLPLVRSCSKGKVKYLLAIPSGFAEVSGEGGIREQELVCSAKERSIRVVGPNTVGMFNASYGLNASMIPELPPGGPGFSCITQSGGYGMAIYMYANNHQLRISKFCDLGNTSDVQVHEIIDYFLLDGDTRIVGVHLESILHREEYFARINALATVKPLIVTKLGRTTAGKLASYAHIGRMPDDIDMRESEESSNIIRAETGLEMLNIAKGLDWQPLPRGRRVGILTGSGGVGVELADLCVEHGLEVPEFSLPLQSALRSYLPYYAGVQNPVDLGPIWWEYPKIYPPLMRTLFTSGEIDLLLVTVIDVATTIEGLMKALTEEVARFNGNISLAKPFYVFWGSLQSMLHHMRILEGARIPCYQSTLETVRAAAAICRYAAGLA